ncbi:hypothetical protein UPYG_G00220210 [Umbra pygmaea]|uniref:Uncharacterized protein n=1 Tax=Umbra pygmaea TaxID=75934 RepID=A0ABD0WBC6_UMBPY
MDQAWPQWDSGSQAHRDLYEPNTTGPQSIRQQANSPSPSRFLMTRLPVSLSLLLLFLPDHLLLYLCVCQSGWLQESEASWDAVKSGCSETSARFTKATPALAVSKRHLSPPVGRMEVNHIINITRTRLYLPRGPT